MIRKARAVWRGTGRDGDGDLTTDSGVLSSTPYSFKTRFEGDPGTNPEELIAAAHAGCFTMALSAKLTEAGFPPTSLDTRAQVDLSMENGPAFSQIKLTVKGVVPGIDATQFQAFAADAEKNCPVSKALSAVPISMEAELVS